MKTAEIDYLSSGHILAYVPHVTPEHDGVMLNQDERTKEWQVEGGGKYPDADREAAIAEAKKIAASKWGE